MAKGYADKIPTAERAALRAAALTIIDRFPHFRCLSIPDQAAFYRQLVDCND
jgi:hypothetical protein